MFFKNLKKYFPETFLYQNAQIICYKQMTVNGLAIVLQLVLNNSRWCYWVQTLFPSMRDTFAAIALTKNNIR